MIGDAFQRKMPLLSCCFKCIENWHVFILPFFVRSFVLSSLWLSLWLWLYFWLWLFIIYHAHEYMLFSVFCYSFQCTAYIIFETHGAHSIQHRQFISSHLYIRFVFVFVLIEWKYANLRMLPMMCVLSVMLTSLGNRLGRSMHTIHRTIFNLNKISFSQLAKTTKANTIVHW